VLLLAVAPLSARAADAGPVTVPAPAIGTNAEVTVSQTANLGFQAIHVSWKGFPSSGSDLTKNKVRLYECRTEVKTTEDCYGSGDTKPTDPTSLEGVGGSGPDGPGTRQLVITHTDGTGDTDFVVMTGRELPSLGCSSTTKCSLVVWIL